MRFDCLVLGAGIVGISTALHLQRRNLSVALIDRDRPVQETSYGNAGIIQREGVVPYAFPRDAGSIFKYALNLNPSVHVHWLAMPSMASRLYQYWRYGSQRHIALTAQANVPLIEHCLSAHELLMSEASIDSLLRRTGYIAVYRDTMALQAAIASESRANEKYGVNFKALTAREVQETEPHLTEDFAGGILMTDP
ncbi:MAG: NAD(P)/FAD-dependent oxidoreductase, partial [Hyphomicrobiaceae bacterium]